MDITAAAFLSGELSEHLVLILIVMAAPRYASHAFQTGSAQNGHLPHARQMVSKQELAQTQKIAAWYATTKLYAVHQNHAILHALLLLELVIQASSQIVRVIAEAPITIAQTTSG